MNLKRGNEMERIREILSLFDIADGGEIRRFCSEEDGTPYHVWQIGVSMVLKQVTSEEQQVYETFFPGGGGPVPQVYGFREFDGKQYMLMEYVDGETMSRCTREKLRLTLDAMIAMQDRFWEDKTHESVGYSFERSYPNRLRRLQYLGALGPAYEAYLEAFRTVPRTLCNDDMLPFNVLVGRRAVIIDWEYAGILPYPCGICRLIAYGEDQDGAMFRMTEEDKAFALDYYYGNLIHRRGISRTEYERTIKLFLLKEYSEWVYCANSSGDYDTPYYEPYRNKSFQLAKELGFDVDEPVNV